MQEYLTIELLRQTIHYGLHFLFPALVARIFFKDNWKQTYLIFLATMLVDLDHLLADPLFDPQRCSIGFHPLHSYYAIAVYALTLPFKKLRRVSLGLLMHMATDFQDCLWL